MSKTDKQLVEDANDLARKFYAAHGCEVPKGYRFDHAHHPQEIGCWNMAVMAYEHIAATDIESALAGEEEDLT